MQQSFNAKSFNPLLCLATALISLPGNAQSITPDQFKAMLEDTLQKNPEIVQRALALASARATEIAEARARVADAKVLERARANSADMPALGDPHARITIVEALDYQCPYCRAMQPNIEELLAKRRDVRVAILMTPILGHDSEVLTRFALAAQAQGRFAQVHRALFSSPTKIVPNDRTLAALSANAGVDWNQAKAAMNSADVTRHLAQDRADWVAMNGPGTPHIITGKTSFQGATPIASVLAALPPELPE